MGDEGDLQWHTCWQCINRKSNFMKTDEGRNGQNDSGENENNNGNKSDHEYTQQQFDEAGIKRHEQDDRKKTSDKFSRFV